MKQIDLNFVKGNIPLRPDDAHKGSMGTLVNISGSYGYAGAGILSAKAALRSGVGLLYQVIPESVYPVFASSVYEAVCAVVADSIDKTVSKSSLDYILSLIKRANAVSIGCGLKNTDDTKAIVSGVIKEAEIPVIIDADGINAIAEHIDIIRDAKSELILTPHPKEFSRISGLSVEAIQSDREKAVRDFTAKYKNVTLVLKGHRTLVGRNSDILENTTGNSGMAKGGSGDVLTGMIASLSAQGVAPFIAAAMGVFIHGRAGDISAKRLSKASTLPSDIIDSLPEVFREIENNS